MEILEWCREIIKGPGGLEDFERHELVIWHVPREVAVAYWTIKCLSNPKCEGSGEILDAILEKRKNLEGVKNA